MSVRSRALTALSSLFFAGALAGCTSWTTVTIPPLPTTPTSDPPPPPTTTTSDPPPPPTTTTAAPPPPSIPQPAGKVAGPWNLIFDSEFAGSGLNTSQWTTGWFGSGITQPVGSSEEECYDPSQVSVNNGLTLNAISQSESCGGVTRPYTSGIITTNSTFQFTYGYMEARIFLPANGASIADWPAFWADGQNWPADGEIDVLEGLGGQACVHFHNPAGGPGTCVNGGSYAGGWHTFAADWEPGSLTFYYDGEAVWTDSSGITSSPMYLILNLALDSSVSPPDLTPASVAISYVRVWQH